MCDYASIFSAFQSPDCDSTLVCHLRVFIKSLSLKLCICVYVLYRKHWRWQEVNMRHCQDGSKWMWRKPKDCFRGTRGNLTALELLVGIEFASGDLHSFWLRQDKRKWRRSTLCQTTQAGEKEHVEEEKTEIGKGLPASCSTFSHFLLFCFYQWISEIFFVVVVECFECFQLVFLPFLLFCIDLCPLKAIHRPTCTRQPSCTAQLNIIKTQ